MDEPSPPPLATSTHSGTMLEETIQADAPTSAAEEPVVARGSGHISEVPPLPPERRERTEHSVMEGLPEAKAERVAAMRRELAELQRQLIESQQRIATELQGRAEDAERFEALEARLQAQELEARQNAAHAAELEIEIIGLRPQLTSATATAEELHRDVAARDAQLEDARRQHREVTDQLEAQRLSLREANTQLETRDAELATRTTERDTEQATSARLERELADQRTHHRELTDQLELQFTSLRDAKALSETRDAELAAITSERDARTGELEQARRELDATRGKASEIAKQLVRFGQDLIEGASAAQTDSNPEPKPAVAPPRVERQAPPPVPPPRANTRPVQVDTILELTEEPKSATSRVGSGLLTLGGVIVGCVVTFATMNRSSSSAAGDRQEQDAPRASAVAAPPATEPASATGSASATEPVSGPVMSLEANMARSTSSGQPLPGFDTGVNAEAKDVGAPRPTAPAESSTDGVILLSPAAARHRLFVDGKVVEVKRSRAVVPCGTHEVRIGSRGTAQTLDVACGGEIMLPAETDEQ